jgi:hypothetical protein
LVLARACTWIAAWITASLGQTGDNRRMGDAAGRMVFLGFEENQLT